MFYFYASLMGFGLFMMSRGIVRRNWDDIGSYFVLVASSFIGLCYCLNWSVVLQMKIAGEP